MISRLFNNSRCRDFNRIKYEGAWYHVMNRGGAYRDIFLRAEHREMFLKHLQQIADKVAEEFGTPLETIFSAKRGVENLPKFVAMYLSRKVDDYPLNEVTSFFGIQHYSRVSKVQNLMKKKIAEDQGLDDKILKIVKRLSTYIKT